MIRRFRVQNFRCLRDLDVELDPFTVLVGPNAAGKSALLEALDPLRMCLVGDKWPGANDKAVRFEASIDGHAVPKSWGFRTDASGAYRYRLVHLDLGKLRQTNLSDESHALEPKGGNLPNTLRSLGRRRLDAFSRAFCELIPLFSEIDVLPLKQGHDQVVFRDRWHPERLYTTSEVSDGTLLTMAYLLLSFEQAPPDLVCVEEPERGLHPYLLGEIITMLRQMTTLDAPSGRPTQVILATHSGDLLGHVEPAEVRFLSRGDDGGTLCRRAPTDDPEWRAYYESYDHSIRDAWLSGGLGGVPGR